MCTFAVASKVTTERAAVYGCLQRNDRAVIPLNEFTAIDHLSERAFLKNFGDVEKVMMNYQLTAAGL
jgi:hypothetical protein